MNSGGPAYGISNAPEFDTEWVLKDPTVRFFDAYSKPIKSLYSQVHWTNHGQIPLPPHVTTRYDDTTTNTARVDADADDEKINTDTMALVGYEVDQVMVDAASGEEVSVPITWAYNHHYMVFLMGKTEIEHATTMAERPVTPAMKREGMGHGVGMATATAITMWLPGVDTDGKEDNDYTNVEQNEPTNTTENVTETNDRSWIFVSEANGGEMRKSYHFYPRGYAQLLRKPHSFSVTPMQIDTWNRDTMANTSRFVPPSPNVNPHDYFPNSTSKRIVDNLKAANYNPLLECPCTDRLSKTWGMTYKLLRGEKIYTNNNGDNDNNDYNDNDNDVDIDHASRLFLENSTECFDAATMLLPSIRVTKKVVPGNGTGICEAVVRSDGSLEVVWNTENTQHGPSSATASRHLNVMEQPFGDSLVGTTPTGSIINATMVLNTTSKTTEITLKGPYLKVGDEDDDHNDRWFAIGLGASSMCIKMEADECTTGGPYAIIVLPDDRTNNSTSKVIERKLDYHGAGRVLSPQQDESGYFLTVLSNQIEYEYEYKEKKEGEPSLSQDLNFDRNGLLRKTKKKKKNRWKRRVVRLLRPFEGPTGDHYSFREGKLQNSPLEIILATGCPRRAAGEMFGRHCGHQSPDPLSFARVDAWQEIIRDGIKGKIGGNPFQKHCLDEPYGDLVKQHNPTCTVQTYQGGLHCCIHDHYLLDAQQKVPWQDRLLEYRLKFRFYYQDYFPTTATSATATAMSSIGTKTAALPSHQDMTRFYWTTEAGAGEYDVPECETPSVPSSCVHVITSKWKVSEFVDTDRNPEGIELIYAGPHCHAPTCLSMELYNSDTGKLLCRVTPLVGKGRSRNSTNSGSGANAAGENEEMYDEAGFIAMPPCLWSHEINHQRRGSGNNDFETNPEQLLPPPEFLSLDTTLLSIKRANNTFSHTGEMASWQMRGVLVLENTRDTFGSSSGITGKAPGESADGDGVLAYNSSNDTLIRLRW